MNLDTAKKEFDKTNSQVNSLIFKREKLKDLILELQHKVRTDTGKGVFRMDQDESLTPREKFREDTKDMWKKSYINNDIERKDKSDISPRDQLNDELSEMWK